MAVGSLSPVAIQQFCDNNGDPLAGGKLFFYLAGTTTPTPAYADVGLTTPLANPVILDAAGRAPELFLAALTYKQVLQNAAGVTIWTADNIVTPSALRSVNATISITGDQHDVPIPSGVITYIQFNSATAVNVDGFAGGTPGQILFIQTIGAGVVYLVNHSSSLSQVQNRLHNPVGSGPMPMTQFGGSAQYVYQGDAINGYVWRLISHEQGHWIRVPYAAGNFYGNAGAVWTVEAADIQQLDYKLVGTNLLVTIAITNSTLGTDSQHLHIGNLPYSFQTALSALPASGCNNATTYELAAMGMTANTRELIFAKATLQSWIAAVNSINLFAQAFLDVQ